MSQPQQPELRRSGENAAVDDHARTTIGVGGPSGGEEGPRSPVPEDNRPGHHPRREQDKPDPGAFAERLGIPKD